MLLLTKITWSMEEGFLLSIGELAGFMDTVPLAVDIWSRGDRLTDYICWVWVRDYHGRYSRWRRCWQLAMWLLYMERIIGTIDCEAYCLEVGRFNCKDGLKFIDLNISEIGDLKTKRLLINNKILSYYKLLQYSFNCKSISTVIICILI